VTITATAPGKLLISGEYAVLDGAAAISLAVDRHATVTIGPCSDGADSALTVRTTGDACFPFSWSSDGSIDFPVDPAGRGSLLRAALICFSREPAALPVTMPQVQITIDSAGFYTVPDTMNTDIKLGLGSSAAVCVALTGALAKLFGIAGDIQQLALDVHHEFQKKAGSGVDVVNSYQGGMISYRRSFDENIAPQTSGLSWPQGLYMLPVWTGEAASTTELLARFDRYRDAEPATFGPAMAELKTAADSLEAAWQNQPAVSLMDALALHARKLKDLDTLAGVGIYSARHVDFQKRAAAIGAVYKPSGAGGGDFGLMFTDSSATLEQLSAEFAGDIVLKDWSATASGLHVEGAL